MNEVGTWLVSIVIALIIAALGCYLSVRLLPAGVPRLLGEIFSVSAGFAAIPVWRRLQM